MGLTVRHKFVSAKADSSDVTLINPSNWNDDHQITNTDQVRYATDFDFTAQVPGGNLTGGISNTITLTPVPKGVNGTNKNFYVLISNGIGTAEAVLVTGGTAISGNPTGTLTFTCANNHTGAWTISSASNGIMEAYWDLPTSGGIVDMGLGVKNIWGTLVFADGVQGSPYTQSTRNNFWIRGAGRGREEGFAAATELLWMGSNGGTVIKIQGPTNCVKLSGFRINGNLLSSLGIDIYASRLGIYKDFSIVNQKAGCWAMRLDAGADFNANTRDNTFEDIFVSSLGSGSSGINIGPTTLNFNAGNFHNVFSNVDIMWNNDTAGSIAIQLGWADNNAFNNCNTQIVNVGSGAAVKYVRQSPGTIYDFLPSENQFNHTTLGGNGISGDAGRGIGSFYWPYQVFDSGGIPNNKNHRGVLTDGTFFDTSYSWGFKDKFKLYCRSDSPGAEGPGIAIFDIIGFTHATVSGTVQTTGTALIGTGTSFLSQLPKGTAVNYGGQFRTVVAIADDTHATLNQAFSDDVPAGGSIGRALGANSRVFADGALNFAVQNALDIILWTNGLDRFHVHSGGDFTGQGRFVPGMVVREYGAGASILTAGDLINGIVKRTAGGPVTDTLPTAAQIVGAIGNCKVNMTIEFYLINNSGGTHTLALSTGVTDATGVVVTKTTTAGNVHKFKLLITNPASGSEACQLFSLGQSAS